MNSGWGGHIFVVNEAGEVLWRYDMTEIYPDQLELNKPPLDKLGHIFINWNPGRYNGVTVLKPIRGGFEDFETLQPKGEYDTRFYWAEVVDRDKDGTFEVDVFRGGCGAADCEVTTEAHRWDGHGYSPGDHRKSDSGTRAP